MHIIDYDVIIIRGAPGVGKSTLIKLLKKKYANGVTVEVDTIRGMINNVKWINKDEHIHSLNATIALSREYLKAGYSPILVIDTLGKSRMKQFMLMLNQMRIKGRPVKYYTISLFCKDDVLVNRIINRPDGFKDVAASRIINNEMAKSEFPPELLIDTSSLTPKQVLEVICDELDLN
jgi:adenylate kinase family enzyme